MIPSLLYFFNFPLSVSLSSPNTHLKTPLHKPKISPFWGFKAILGFNFFNGYSKTSWKPLLCSLVQLALLPLPLASTLIKLTSGTPPKHSPRSPVVTSSPDPMVNSWFSSYQTFQQHWTFPSLPQHFSPLISGRCSLLVLLLSIWMLLWSFSATCSTSSSSSLVLNSGTSSGSFLWLFWHSHT